MPGGVKQRITITRALAAVDDPKIILFDEANALLDPQSDLGLVALLRKFSAKATMILVSHRPTVLDLADRTFVLGDGRLKQGFLRPSGAPAVPRKEPAA